LIALGERDPPVRAQSSFLAFGSDLTSTINDTSLFQFSGGFTSAWNDGNSTFTITAIPEPSTYVAAIGLLALMLWTLRHRLRGKA
jgi:hypothetical protein